MNCATHADTEATGFCSRCGKALCAQCAHDVRGTRYCETCLATLLTAAAAPPTDSVRHPWVAFGLGWIPGMGAVYNGEYVKALVHVAIFAGLVTLNSRGASQPLWGLACAFFICYMPVEAYIRARDHGRNRPAFEQTATPLGDTFGRAPIGPIVLIVLGILFLLDNLHILEFDWVLNNGWPLLLIGLGAWLLWQRTREKV